MDYFPKRLAIHSASAKYAINSCCYVAQVKYSKGPELLQIVFKDEGSETPTNQNTIINQIKARPDIIESVFSVSIDTIKSSLSSISTRNVDTESI